MAHWFEDLTKQMADEKIGRRTAIRHIASGIAGVALASAVPGLALAKTNKHCPNGGGTCSNPNWPNCAHNSNLNCYCFVNAKGRARCGCNMYCDGPVGCSKDSDCAKGSFCAPSTGCSCGGGVCIVKCRGKNKNCQLTGGHGPTAARVI